MAETKKTTTDVPVDSLLKRYAESEDMRKKKYMDNWEKAKKYYDGDQWYDQTNIAWFQSNPVFNKVFEFVEIMRSYLADNKWGLDVFPVVIPEDIQKQLDAATAPPEDDELAETQRIVGAYLGGQIVIMVEKINKLLDFLWLDQRTQQKLAQVLLYVFLYGTGFLKATFNGTNIGDTGIGQIETQPVSPYYIYPDPAATSVHDASFIIQKHPVTYRWIIERYPEKAWEVKEKGLGSQDEYFQKGGSAGVGIPDTEEAKRVDVLECYYIDSSIVEDAENESEVKLAYPNGRVTIMTKTGVVLEDYENPYSMFPFVRFVEIPRPGEFFGDATVWRGLGVQDTINSLLRHIIDNGTWLTHGIWVADTTSGVTPKKLAGYAPRSVVMKNPGTEVRRDGGAMLPGHVFNTLEQQVQAFDRVVGLPDVLRGIVPSRQPVGTVQMQKEAGDVRTRERARRVEEALEDLGTLWIDIVKNHWNDKRTISGKQSVGGLDMFQLSKKDLEDWMFAIHVVPGSTTPLDTDALVEKAIRMRTEAGIPIPDEYIVELSRLPGALSALFASKSAIQQQQAQAPAPEMPQEAPVEAPVEEEMPGSETEMALEEAAQMGLSPEEVMPQAGPQAGGLDMM